MRYAVAPVWERVTDATELEEWAALMDARLLPELFSTMYEALTVKAMDDGLGGSRAAEVAALGKADGKPVNQWRDNSGAVTSMDKTGGPKTKQVGKTSRTMKDERAFRLKVKMDKRLRKMGREISAFLDGRNAVDSVGRICAGRCRKIGEGEWKYCPHCGGPMREADGNGQN